METDHIIGIDLGTTYSCVAVWKNGHVEIIPNDMGLNTTPSCVSFSDNERLIGQLAKDSSVRNPKNTIYDVKRLIGRKIDDPAISTDLQHWPFKVTGNDQHQPLITATYHKKEQTFFPEEISAMILEKLKSYAEDYLCQKVRKVVITVPAYFNDSQRQATTDAAKIAGLECVRIINEPTAAALAYGLDKNCIKEEKVLIFDLGGGTLDVSLLAIENGTFEVMATSGDSHLGGEDFDNRLVTHLCSEFDRTKPIDVPSITSNLKAVRKLKVLCEKAKITLSSATNTVIEIDSVHNGIDFTYNLSRLTFEELCKDLFKKCNAPIQRVLRDAKIRREDVHEIVLVGGSTRIPYIQQQLRDFFDGRELNKSVHPDEAVARGAAIQGSILSKLNDKKTQDLVLLDVTPLSLGVETAGGIMSFIIERNTPLPCTKRDIYTTYTDNQKAVEINIYEGERHMTKFNNKLGHFELVNIISPEGERPRGIPQIEVVFDIDNNGILTVSATDVANSNKNQIQIVKNKGRLTEPEITKLIEDAEKYRRDDLQMKAQIEMKNKLETLMYHVRLSLTDEDIEKNISSEEKTKLLSMICTIKSWLDDNPNAPASEYEQHKAGLEQIRNIIFTRIYADIPIP